MQNFDHLKWTSLPQEPGWYFAWMGLGGMRVYKVIPQVLHGQLTVLGGKNDGAPMVPVADFGARLWAGPVDVDDPKTLSNSEPPILPESEYHILQELKRRLAEGGKD